MNDLKKVGLSKGVLFESILSTYSSNAKPNAAPMGVKSEDMKHLIINVYKTAKTYENLKNKGCAVVNFVVDPILFYLTAIKNEVTLDDRYLSLFEKAVCVDAPRLREVDAFLEVSVINMNDNLECAQFLCRVEHWKAFASPFRPYCRGLFAVIESIIHATRIKVFLSQGNIIKAKRGVEWVNYYHDLTKRIAPNSKYLTIMNEIIAKIGVWQENMKK